MAAGSRFILAADIGASKTDLGLFTPTGKGELPCRRAQERFPSVGSSVLFPRIAAFLARSGVEPRELAAVAFGVAGPVGDGRVRATNLGLELSLDGLRREFPAARVQLVNDLEATARVLVRPGLVASETLQAGSAAGPGGVVGVLAPGTGLGMALLSPRHAGGSVSGCLILPSEGGHTDFAPRNEREVELWRFLKENGEPVTRECLLSGPGLVRIGNWLGGDFRDAGEVGAAAAAGMELARQALLLFAGLLGATAGDLALLGLTTGGIYLAGGIPRKNIAFCRRPEFLAAFRAKGMMAGWLEKVPVRVVTEPAAALLGAALLGAEAITD